MLLVLNYVSKSNIHGLGLFSAEHVKENQVVWRFEPTFDAEIPKSLLNFLLDPHAETVLENAEYHPDREVFVLGNDGDIFMNHSDDPNLIDMGDIMIAARDIQAGEEITCDYRKVMVLGFTPNPDTV